MYVHEAPRTHRTGCVPTHLSAFAATTHDNYTRQLHTTTTHDNYTMVQGAPISETEYDYIIHHVIRTNPFVSGNNSGFGFGTPNVPGYLSLVEVDVVAEAGHPLSVTKRKAADVYDTDLRVYGSHSSHHNLLHKKFKSA